MQPVWGVTESVFEPHCKIFRQNSVAILNSIINIIFSNYISAKIFVDLVVSAGIVARLYNSGLVGARFYRVSLYIR